MKLSTTFLVTLLLLATASFVGAADNPAPNPEVMSSAQAEPAPTEPVADEALFTPAVDCQASAEPLIATGLENAVPASPQTCGACSTPNCQGATRGQQCVIGGIGGGFGNCNIYSGGYKCSTGGWECECGTGPLP